MLSMEVPCLNSYSNQFLQKNRFPQTKTIKLTIFLHSFNKKKNKQILNQPASSKKITKVPIKTRKNTQILAKTPLVCPTSTNETDEKFHFSIHPDFKTIKQH